jgi:tetratricopeptide (TPR) repeat protein
MKKILILALLILAGAKIYAAPTDHLDSLKQKLQLTVDSLKGPVYTEIADVYLKYDTISNRKKKTLYQNEALNYTMLALHKYSYYNDSVGLRVSFDALAKVYCSQRKYSQAKWFVLQSNSISRIKNDVPNIIASLIKLSTIKMEIEDYKLAMSDLNEALRLSIAHKLPELEMATQKNYAYLYNRMDKPEKGALALKRADAIADSIKADEAAIMLAIDKFAADTISTQTIDAAVKKKPLIVLKKPLKTKAKKTPSKKVVAAL